jgi:hypothetical protein
MSMRGPCLSNLKKILTKDYLRPSSKSSTHRKALKTGRGKSLALQNAKVLGASWRMTRLFNTMMARDLIVSQHGLQLFATGPGSAGDLAPLLGECAALKEILTLHLLRTDSSRS